jgi:threonine dehydrogenase-like Zn-dependent dehydrogenase
MEAHGIAIDNLLDTAKVHTFLGTDRAHVFRQVLLACRKGGNVSVPGVYGGVADKIPIGAFMEKGLTLKTGQTHMQRYTRPLLELIEQGKIDSTFLISHRASLEQGPEMYKHWHDDQNRYTKIVLKPEMAARSVERVEMAEA